MKKMTRYLTVSLVFVFGMACLSCSGETAKVTGQILFLKEISLSPEAVVTVRLVDASEPEGSARQIADEVIDHSGKFPIDFELSYDPKKINPEHEYLVKADIKQGDQLSYVTVGKNRVLTQGNPSTARVRVKMMGNILFKSGSEKVRLK